MFDSLVVNASLKKIKHFDYLGVGTKINTRHELSTKFDK